MVYIFYCIFAQKIIIMKKFAPLMLASMAFLAVSCSSSEEDQNAEVEAVAYALDKDASSLKWMGNMGPDYGHEGTVEISEGSLTMKGDEFVEGTFTVDMTSIKNTDLDEPKASYLVAHLSGSAPDEEHPADLFFNVPKYPTVDVKLNSYKDGKLNVTLTIVGKELTQDIEAKISSDEKGASIKGDFAINMDPLGIMGFQKNPEDGSQIGPEIKFSLNVALKK
ncbi:MAG: hypothetical protein A3D92_21235 [Bacteroidetes bacterium RIFCSPHIGHO2_02_FULL_44_7]|nr:MAG: hypothetical protein A3D92_21235 [Bacteroidetes bacterium RIFCSPHIGHO2_02_FULL_44_7]